MGNTNNPTTKAGIIEHNKQSTNALAAFIKGQFDELKRTLSPERWIDRLLVKIAHKHHSWRYVLGFAVVFFFAGAIVQAIFC